MANENNDAPTNEITELARSAKATADSIDSASDPAIASAKRKQWTVGKLGLAAGIGVGSAALVAALLYANKSRNKP